MESFGTTMSEIVYSTWLPDACAFTLDVPLLHRVLLCICSRPVHGVRMTVHDHPVARRGSRRPAATGVPICVTVRMTIAHDAVAVRRRMHGTCKMA